MKEEKTKNKFPFIDRNNIKFFIRIFMPSLLTIISVILITAINFHTNKTRLQNSVFSAFIKRKGNTLYYPKHKGYWLLL